MTRYELNALAQPLMLGVLFGMAIFSLLTGSTTYSGVTVIITTPVDILCLNVVIEPLDLGYLFADDFMYELVSLMDLTQGLYGLEPLDCELFNPGSDVDLSASTDFEDLAAPAADVSEFADQDRSLLSDSMASTVFWNGFMGGLLGVSIHFLLTTDLWRFIS